MLLPDVNILIYAAAEREPLHATARRWLEDALDGPQDVGISSAILVGAVRILTGSHRFPGKEVLGFIEAVCLAPATVHVEPGNEFRKIFAELVAQTGATGRMVSDIAIAALAIEHDATVVSYDELFGRLPGVKWLQPR